MNKQFHLVIVDEDYLLVASHIDTTTYNKIIAGDYVDFARLISKDKILQEEDQRLEVVIRGDRTFWVPAEKNSLAIQNFTRWEQAFRVYSDIYLRRQPDRSTELIQYNHIIHMASLTYTWDNVYSYDKDFRLHLSRHPERSWGIILQQAWSMRLKDKLIRGDNHAHQMLSSRESYGNSRSPGDQSQGVDVNNICRRYNRGHCTFRQTCRYDHRCSFCFKFGHSVINCRKLQSDRNRPRDSRGYHDHRDKRLYQYDDDKK